VRKTKVRVKLVTVMSTTADDERIESGEDEEWERVEDEYSFTVNEEEWVGG
jgi:hypothetical protein